MDRSGIRRGLLAGGIALLLGVAAILLLRPASSDPRPPGPSTVDPDRDPPLAAASAPSGAPSAEPTTPGVRLSPLDPALVGRGRLTMRVVRAGTRERVVGASTVLHGTGHGGERIRVTGTSDQDGRVTLVDVAAGPWLSLHVEAPGLLATDRADVDVVRGQTLDLGDVALVASRTVRVRALDERLSAVEGAVVEVHALDPGQARAMRPGYLRFLPSCLEHLGDPAVATTDAQGLAVVEGVPPGDVLVSARRPGHVTARLVVRVPGEVDPELPELILRQGVAVAGRVVDTAGQPLGGALLVASDRHRGIDAEDDPPRWARADASGRFELRLPEDALPGGLWVRSDDHPARWVGVEAPGGDLRIVLDGGVPFELVAVHETTNAPVPDAVVELEVAPAASPGEPLWSSTSTTDNDGRIRTTLPRGRLEHVNVRAPGFIHAHGPDGGRYDASLTRIPAAPDLAPGPAVRLVARLRPWPSWPLDGRVVDERGLPVPGVVMSTTSWGAPEPAARTDGSGWFEDVVDARDGVPGPKTWLRVLSPGWVVVRPWSEVQRDDPRRRASVTVTVQPSATIRGRVVASDGTGLPNVSVSWTGPAHGDGGGGETTSRSDGTFLLTDLETTGPSGDRERSGRVEATADGFLPAWSPAFHLIPGRTADVGLLVMSRGATVVGQVLDPHGAPAAGVRVGVYPVAWCNPPGLQREDVRFTLTDVEGRFRVTGVLRSAWVAAEPRGSTEGRAHVTAPKPDEPAEVSVTLRLPAAGLLVGTVVDESGAPCEATLVVRRRAKDAPHAEEHELGPVRTDAQGRFRLPSVPLGPARLTACTSERLGTVEVDPAAGTPIQVVIEPSADAWPTAIGFFGPDRIPRPPRDTSR